MDQKRRILIKALGASGTLALAGCGGSSSKRSETAHQSKDESIQNDGPKPTIPSSPLIDFLHGVASGDPLATQVILWTRVTPEAGFEETATVPVTATVATDPDMNQVVAHYETSTDVDRDYCVKVDATGLDSDRWYYYQFSAGQQLSPVGRTRTFPATSTFIDRARFAVVSCSSFAHGHFSVYNAVAKQTDLDFVLHLGDYIYEHGAGEYGNFPGRDLDPPHEIVTREDYRRRHAQCKTDEDLQALHQQFPLIAIWDDHESANDSWSGGAENHDPLTEGDWQDRKNAARDAYFEWMPIRPHEPGNTEIIYRRFHFGDLIDLTMLDTRLERPDAPLPNTIGWAAPALTDPNRRMISDEQRAFLLDNLSNPLGHWRFIGQQVMFAAYNIIDLQSKIPEPFNNKINLFMDQWDGYPTERDTILRHIEENQISNVVVLTGDIHSSYANEVSLTPAILTPEERTSSSPPVAVEFITPSVTSPSDFPGILGDIVSPLIPELNPHIRYNELKSHGFILVDVTPDRAQAEFHYVNSIDAYDLRGQIDRHKTKVVSVRSGDSHLEMDGDLSRPRLLRTALFNPPVENSR